MDITLRIAQDTEADGLLGRSPLAALVGMLLDQQVPMEWAFSGPLTIARRLGGDDLDAHEIAAYDPDAFAELLSAKPAVHRYPGSMAGRVQQLCQYLVDHYDGDAEAVWRGVDSGKEVLKRLNELPGFGKQKAQIFLALLGKQLGVRPRGWREAAGVYGEEGAYRSAADITGPETLRKVRAHKQALKQEAKRAAAEAKRAATGTEKS
ncbi:HhH-GPD-type base excision DNA repair protein [Streptomyces varsoviensis]|uniref:Fe-S cluster assembly protein HesB n=1 Tax=Streptomyces varsoviensis TaxID=67373 RepID=A0ABR5J243_9ACTN|nr:HhH-GPD-type base excision DNA repair protein [Streptomyces varsoviensis]KOG87497.1 Fe-S cluster assembly protein HesB [Streptomyces varsoviensis]